jgi:hypothetical protein
MITINSLKKPEIIVESAWLEHAPFAFWLMEKHKPKITVELGSYNGFSFFCFCQGQKENKLPARVIAIDTWKGDDHTDYYSEEVYLNVKRINEERYAETGVLMRSKFDEAVSHFEDSSIDLLHIDGLHTYEAVKNDFETWLPKLSDRAIVLFHDTQVREKDFGVWKYWSEISAKYPSFEFAHGHGLGMLCVGKNISSEILDLTRYKDEDVSYCRELFARLGETITNARNSKLILERNETITNQLNYIKELEHICEERLSLIRDLDLTRRDLEKIIKDHKNIPASKSSRMKILEYIPFLKKK